MSTGIVTLQNSRIVGLPISVRGSIPTSDYGKRINSKGLCRQSLEESRL